MSAVLEWSRVFDFPGHYVGHAATDAPSAPSWRLQKTDALAQPAARRWRLLYVPTMGVTHFQSMRLAKAYADDVQFLRDNQIEPNEDHHG